MVRHRVRAQSLGSYHDAAIFIAGGTRRVGVAGVVSGYTAVAALVSCVKPNSSEPIRFAVRSICRALPRVLIHLLLRLLRHRCTGVLRGIRTSKLHERIAAGAAIAVVVQGQCLGVVVAASGFYRASEDVCDSGSLVLEIFSAASGEEGDEEED
jgi:hypothetical protein